MELFLSYGESRSQHWMKSFLGEGQIFVWPGFAGFFQSGYRCASRPFKRTLADIFSPTAGVRGNVQELLEYSLNEKKRNFLETVELQYVRMAETKTPLSQPPPLHLFNTFYSSILTYCTGSGELYYLQRTVPAKPECFVKQAAPSVLSLFLPSGSPGTGSNVHAG